MQLLHESLLDAFTTDTGEVDYSRKGGMSLAKQVPSASLHARARTARFYSPLSCPCPPVCR